MRFNANRQYHKGLTLIEVLVALAIFALAGGAAIKAATEHIRGVRTIEEITFATWVANNRITQIQLQSQWPPKNNTRGSSELAGRTWYWTQAVKNTNNNNLKAIEVSIGLTDDHATSVTTVTTYVSKPQDK